MQTYGLWFNVPSITFPISFTSSSRWRFGNQPAKDHPPGSTVWNIRIDLCIRSSHRPGSHCLRYGGWGIPILRTYFDIRASTEYKAFPTQPIPLSIKIFQREKKKRKKRKQERKEHPTQHTEVKWFPNINWFWQPGQIFRLPKWENTLEKGKTHNISQINISSNSACPISRPNNHKGVSSYLNDIVLSVSPGVPAWYTNIHLAKPSQQFQYHSQSTML